MNMKSKMRKKGILMSVFIGTIMGLVFSIISQLKNQHTIIPMGVLSSIVISMIISFLIGIIVPVKLVNDKVCEKLKITPDKRLPFAVSNAFVSNLIFAPLNCIVNMWYGMSMSLTDLPPEVKNVFERMGYCAKQPYFMPALISSLIFSLIIGFFICLFVTPAINKLTNKICGIPMQGRPE